MHQHGDASETIVVSDTALVRESRRGFWFVAHAGLAAALLLSVSARPKRGSQIAGAVTLDGTWWFVRAEAVDLRGE